MSLFSMFTMAFGLPNPSIDITSKLVPRNPAVQLPILDEEDDDGVDQDDIVVQPVVVHLGEQLEDVLAGSTVDVRGS
jgi:hypothetical protein